MNQISGNSRWSLLDENGSDAVPFTSFIDISYANEGSALSYPIEQGAFVNYNKTQAPLDIKVTLGFQGEDADFEPFLVKLDTYKKDAVKLFVTTPSIAYESMTLKSYTYNRTRENNAGMLTVTLNLVEVREVETYTGGPVSSPRNPTSANTVNTGKTQSSVLTDLWNSGMDWRKNKLGG